MRAVALTLAAAAACSHHGAPPAPSHLAIDVWAARGPRSPQLADQAIAVPLARALGQEAGVGHVTTTTDARGVHAIAWIASGVDTFDILTRLDERVQHASGQLPSDAAPSLTPRARGAVVRVIARRPHGSLVELRSWIDWELSRAARTAVGTSDAEACGGLDARITVTVDLQRLDELGVTVAEVIAAVRRGPPSDGSGSGSNTMVIRAVGTVQSVDQLRELAIPIGDGGVHVTLDDVAKLEDDGVPDPCPADAPADAVVLDVRLRPDADAGPVLDALHRAEAAAPAGATFETAHAPLWFDVALAGRMDPATALADRWRAAIAGAPGVLAVEPAAPAATGWDVDAAAAARTGTTLDVDDTVAALGDGLEVNDLYRGEQRVPIWVRVPAADLARVRVRGADRLVPLAELVHARSGAGRVDTLDHLPATIVRFEVADGDDADAIATGALDRARAAAPPGDVTVTSWREP